MKKSAWDYQNDVSNLYLKAGQAKAVTDAFCGLFADATEEGIQLAVRASITQYIFLSHAMEDLVHEVYKMAEQLNDTEIEEKGA